MDYNREPIEVVSPNSYEAAKTFLRFQGRKTVLLSYLLLVFSIGSGFYNIMVTGNTGNTIWIALAVSLAVFNIAMAKGLHFSRKTYERSYAQISKGFRYLFRNDEVILINLLKVGDEEWKPIFNRVFLDNQVADEASEAIESAEATPAKPELPDGWNTLLYSSIIKLVEGETAFYLYISRNGALIVAKDGFTREKMHDFVKLMEDKLGNRFQRLKTKY